MQTVFLITNEKGTKFYNANYKAFMETIPNVTLYNSKKLAESVVKAHNLSNVKINEITEKQFTDELMIHSTDVILALEVARSYIERLRFNVPMISGANKQLNIHMKNMSEKLKFISPIFNKRTHENEDLSLMAHASYEELYTQLAKVPYFKIHEIVKMVKNFNELDRMIVKDSEVVCQFSENIEPKN